MKTIIAAVLAASTVAVALPTAASAFDIQIGPRGGVGVGIGDRGYGDGYGRSYEERRFDGGPRLREGRSAYERRGERRGRRDD